MPNPHLTHIVFVLDRSGSMDPLRQAAVDGFNEFLARQRALPGSATVTLVQFSTEVAVTWENLPILEAHLAPRAYRPGGGTALHDAVAQSIDRTGSHLARLPESQRPGKVLFAILTDGEENSSVQFGPTDVEKRIRHQSELYGWEFFFLGASAAWMDQAATMGILEEHALPFDATESGMALAMEEMGARIECSRMR